MMEPVDFVDDPGITRHLAEGNLQRRLLVRARPMAAAFLFRQPFLYPEPGSVIDYAKIRDAEDP